MTSFVIKDSSDNTISTLSVDSSQITSEDQRIIISVNLSDGSATLGNFISQLGNSTKFEVDGAQVANGVLKTISLSNRDENGVSVDSFQFSVE